MVQSLSTAAGDIDRKALRALVGRFRALHAAHYTEIRARLAPEQRTLLDALPVLLHSNHAALPGFIDFEVPAGIDGYQPDAETIAAARKFALSYTFERFKVRASHIQSVVLQPTQARTFTLWVLTPRANHEALAAKLAALTRFAASLELTLNCRLIDALEVRARRDGGLGETPALTLDGWYREGILLAGRWPIWWLVPVTSAQGYRAYCERLRQQRFVAPADTVDLGATTRIPPRECLLAAIGVLTAALDAPYDWLPRLTLIESYLAGFGTTLADRLKQHVHDAGVAADADTDDFLHQIETYLSSDGDHHRLDLIRRCAILGDVPGAAVRASREWHWTPAQLRHLRNRGEWCFRDWCTESAQIRHSLEQSIARFTAAPAATPAVTAQLDALAAELRRRFGNGDVNPALLPRRWAPTLSLDYEASRWRLLEGAQTVSEGARLADLAVWAHAHRLDPRNLQGQAAAQQRLTRLLTALNREPPIGQRALLVVNAEEAAPGTRTGGGDLLISNFDDALDFSGLHVNLVVAVDYLTATDDGKLRSIHYQGDDGIVQALSRAMAEASSHRCLCIDGDRQQAIATRLTDLISQGRSALARGSRFVHALGASFVVHSRLPGGTRVARHDSEAALAVDLNASPETVEFDAYNSRLATLGKLPLRTSARAAPPRS
jgi:adenylate cyclase class 1